MQVDTAETLIRGTPISEGIAIGKPFFFTIKEGEIPEFPIAERDVKNEIKRFKRAIARSRNDVKQLEKQFKKERVDEGASILEAHIHMMQDPALNEQVEREIETYRKNAEYVFWSIINGFKQKFDNMTDPVFRERFKDLQDIFRRVMSYLTQSASVSLADIPLGSIVFAHSLSAADVAEACQANVCGIVTEEGGATSHAAIVAKAKGIPYVTSAQIASLNQDQIDCVIIDGRNGDVVLSPNEGTLAQYQQLHHHLCCHYQKLEHAGALPSETYDGYQVRLSANIDSTEQLKSIHANGASGVGLFRSENIFYASEKFPSEEEQYVIYKDSVEKLEGLPIVIRTFDIGGDKFMLREGLPVEGNPFLGCRAIRFLLKERAIFEAQLRAILRASAHGDVHVLFPMISALSELLEAKEILHKLQEDLLKEGVPIGKKIKVGCMIEVPSAAIIADLLAKECDFLSIGTNDLVQYSLAVDRGNQALSRLYAPTDPSIIRLIKLVVHEANQGEIPVSVCGEIAADPRFTPLLLGLGVHELSVSPRHLPIIKNAIRQTSIVYASQLADQVLSLKTAQAIQSHLNREYQKLFPDDALYTVKDER